MAKYKTCYIEGCGNKRQRGSYFCSDQCRQIYWPNDKKEFRFTNQKHQQMILI